MVGTTYSPVYKKIFKFHHTIKLDSLDAIQIPHDELEVMCIIQGNNIQIFKYLPFNLKKIKQKWIQYDVDVAEGVWCDYFLDGCTSGSVELRHYSEPRYKGHKALKNQKGLFVKIETWNDINNDEINTYIKLRRVLYHDCSNLDCDYNEKGKCWAYREQRSHCLKTNKI